MRMGDPVEVLLLHGDPRVRVRPQADARRGDDGDARRLVENHGHAVVFSHADL